MKQPEAALSQRVWSFRAVPASSGVKISHCSGLPAVCGMGIDTLGLTGESPSLKTLILPQAVCDPFSSFICVARSVIRTYTILIKSPQMPLLCKTDCQWDSLDICLTHQRLGPPSHSHRGETRLLPSFHPPPHGNQTQGRRPTLPTTDGLSAFLASFIGRSVHLIPRLGTAICHSVLCPSRGLNGLLAHNKN